MVQDGLRILYLLYYFFHYTHSKYKENVEKNMEKNYENLTYLLVMMLNEKNNIV